MKNLPLNDFEVTLYLIIDCQSDDTTCCDIDLSKLRGLVRIDFSNKQDLKYESVKTRQVLVF